MRGNGWRHRRFGQIFWRFLVVHENNGAQLNGKFLRVELFCWRGRVMMPGDE
jgi:hypothetical protein